MKKLQCPRSITVPIIFLLLLIIIFPFTNIANAAPSVSFDTSLYTPGDFAIITVSDSAANLNSSGFDTVNVTVISTSDPSGIIVTLNETGINTGVFTNKGLIFASNDQRFSLGNVITISVSDSTLDTNSSSIQTISSSVSTLLSDLSLDSTINPFVLTETAVDSGVFSNKITLTSGPTTTDSIHATPGGFLTVTNLVSGKTTNALILPNPDGIDNIDADIGDTITVSYPGATSDVATLISGIGGGGGGGGVIKPVLVVDSQSGAVDSGGDSSEWMSKPTFGRSHNNLHQFVTEAIVIGNKLPYTVTFNHHLDLEKIDFKTGDLNTISIKSYNSKPLKFHEIWLGCDVIGTSLNNCETGIEVLYGYDGEIKDYKIIQKLNLIDPETVSVSSSKEQCSDLFDMLCDKTTFSFVIREPLLYDIVAISAIDYKLRQQITWLNDGLHFDGENYNPPMEMSIASSDRQIRGLVKVIQIDREHDLWINTQNNITFKRNSFGTFIPLELSLPEKITDNDWKVMKRQHSSFDELIKNEELAAKQKWDSQIIQSEPISPRTIEYPDQSHREKFLEENNLTKWIRGTK